MLAEDTLEVCATRLSVAILLLEVLDAGPVAPDRFGLETKHNERK